MNSIFTIGFTGKSAEKFFELLKNSGARRLVDVRLNNISQLAAFAKKDDLKYFLKALLNWEYFHKPELAPSEEILSDYRKKIIDWPVYEKRYIDILNSRNILENIKREKIIDSVLLCSEHSPKYCHRRLLAEYFADHWEDISIVHLM
jgi:uncharacterized protein (DUF488 family)